MYPGYRHARTLGNIVSKGGNEEERRGEKSKREEGDGNGKERKGAWRGEEREARGYVFELVDDDDDDGHKVVQQRKRRRRSSSGSSSDSDD